MERIFKIESDLEEIVSCAMEKAIMPLLDGQQIQ